MEILIRTLEQLFNLKLNTPLQDSGTIHKDELTIKYVLKTDAFKKIFMDFLIFDDHGFPPLHKRINANGTIRNLKSFQYSIMYASQREKMEEETTMKKLNLKTANLLVNKGLAEKSEDWIQKYL